MKYYVEFDYAIDFDDALLKAAKPLLKNKDITTQYIESIYQVLEQEGCYFVLLDKIAFVHGDVTKGSTNEAISVLVLDEIIRCYNEDIKIMFLLSGQTQLGHLKMLQHIAQRLQNDNDKLLLELTNKEDIISLLFG